MKAKNDVEGKIAWQSTLIGNFLGGEVLPTKPLESLVRGTDKAEMCLETIESLFGVLKFWSFEKRTSAV